MNMIHNVNEGLNHKTLVLKEKNLFNSVQGQ